MTIEANAGTQNESTDDEEISLRDSLTAAFAEAGVDSESQSITRGRDDAGRFSKAAEAADEGAPVEVETQAVDKPAQAEAVATETAPAVQPPAAWSADAKAEWTTLTPKAQAIITAREAEVHKGFTKLDEDRSLGRTMRDTLSPYMATINAMGATPHQAVQSLLNADHILRNGAPAAKTQLLAQIATQFGVDLSSVVAGAPAPDSSVQALQRQVAELTTYINGQAQDTQQNTARTLLSEISTFSDGKPHFEALRPLMASLMEQGTATSLQAAYDQAFRAHPTTSQLWLDGEVAKRTTGAADAAKARVAKAKGAAVSVTGSPGANGAASRAEHSDLRSALVANFQASGFRV